MIKTAFKWLAFLIALVSIMLQVTIQLEGDKWQMPVATLAEKTAIVTGANSGLGFETCLNLASKDAKVIMACRSETKCQEAADQIQKLYPHAQLFPMLLDLADLSSVKAFATEFLKTNQQLHLLFNNAAIMAVPFAQVNGVESQHATNHLGHFALTGLLKMVLESTPGARVINHSSSASDMCEFLEKPHLLAKVSSEEYDAWLAYSCSKRANRYFTWSLTQKLKGVVSISCHPGWTATNLQHRATGIMDGRILGVLSTVANALFAQPNSLGVQPQLMAAFEKTLKGGELVGPKYYMFGSPVIETSGFCELDGKKDNYLCSQANLDALWEQSEVLTGVIY